VLQGIARMRKESFFHFQLAILQYDLKGGFSPLPLPLCKALCRYRTNRQPLPRRAFRYSNFYVWNWCFQLLADRSFQLLGLWYMKCC